ncbi:MAG TPA: hypothetical protein VNI20_07200, partial [Fimbriimonadaceae bacterium]|nr:hypothetical protein [Fimbriimonadaceae bacterium]
GGVVNLLTGSKEDLLPHLARHMDVNALDYRDGDEEAAQSLVEQGAENVKRVRIGQRMSRAGWLSDKAQGLGWIERFVETKTVWHPVGV